MLSHVLKSISASLLMLVFCAQAHAATPTYVSQTALGLTGRMAISGALGFYGSGGATITANNSVVGSNGLSGLFGLGGDFDYFTYTDTSVGGIFRYYSTSDTGGPTEYSVSVMTVGGTIKAYIFDTPNWTGDVLTGLGMLTATSKVGSISSESGTNFGFYFGATILYKWNSEMSFGIENLRMLAIGDKLNGWPINDLMAKLRFMY